MTLYDTRGSNDLSALKTADGTAAPFSQPAGGCTLANSTTYVFPVGSDRSPVPGEVYVTAVQLKWSAALAATITVETCNFPATIGGAGQGGVDVSDWDTAAGNWIQENPSTAYVPVTGAGNTSTALVVTAGGSAAGGCMIHLGNMGSLRVRIKVVVTTGGLVRASKHGKLGA